MSAAANFHIRLLRPERQGYAPLGLAFPSTSGGRLMFFSRPGEGRIGLFQVPGGEALPKQIVLRDHKGVIGKGSFVAGLRCTILTVEAWPKAAEDGRIWLKWVTASGHSTM